MAKETDDFEESVDDDDFGDTPKVSKSVKDDEETKELETEEVVEESISIVNSAGQEVQLTNHEKDIIAKNGNEFTREYDVLAAMVKSKMLPEHIKTPESAFAIIMMGRELGFDRMTAANNILNIKGTLTLKADAQAALMMNAGVRWKVIYDGHYIFSNGEILPIKPFAGKRSSDGKSWLAEPAKDKDGKPYFVYDRITRLEVKFLGETHIVDYYWSDAKQNGLTEKDNWIKMPKSMMFARCISKARIQIASGTTKGLYTSDEIIDSMSNPPKVERNEKGNVIKTIEI